LIRGKYSVELMIYCKSNNTVDIDSFLPSKKAIAELKLQSISILFKNKESNIQHETTIIITVVNSDFNETNVSN
jgi:hypothetical protein